MAKCNYKITHLRREVYGYYDEIATRAGVSKSTVSKVLNGEFMNANVIEKAIEVRGELRQEKQVLLNKI